MEEKKPGRKSNPTTKKKGSAQNDKEAAYPGNEKEVAYQNKDITSKPRLSKERLSVYTDWICRKSKLCCQPTYRLSL